MSQDLLGGAPLDRRALEARGADWRRTHRCGALRTEHAGPNAKGDPRAKLVVLNGWVHGRRNLGGIYFVDLRDRYGLTQVVLGAQFSEAVRLSAEDVIAVTGKVVARAPGRPGSSPLRRSRKDWPATL